MFCVPALFRLLLLHLLHICDHAFIAKYSSPHSTFLKATGNKQSLGGFDPRISPHLYPNGTPSSSIKKNIAEVSDVESNNILDEKVGILLIDHGSKREASNNHIVRLAEFYQNSKRCPDHFIVRAAHMEIAPPSIEEGIRELVNLGATRIVCHPYFLSPGRHSTEDVPELISDAELKLQRPDIKIITTEPIGSRVDVLVNAIGDIVEDKIIEGFGKDEGLGFLGEVMSMMDEQSV